MLEAQIIGTVLEINMTKIGGNYTSIQIHWPSNSFYEAILNEITQWKGNNYGTLSIIVKKNDQLSNVK